MMEKGGGNNGGEGYLYEFKYAVSTAVELAPTDDNNCEIRTNKMRTFYINVLI